MKATGTLIQPDGFYPAEWVEGDTVTIELPKGIRVIGNCKECLKVKPFNGKFMKFVYPHEFCAAVNGKGCGRGKWKASGK